MFRLLLKWLLSALALILVTKVVPGIVVDGFAAALVAALVIGLLNATVGALLKLITFPLAILTLGLFFLVINALMLIVAGHLVPGFHVYGFPPAFVAAIGLAILHMLFSWLDRDREPRRRDRRVIEAERQIRRS